MTAKGEKIREQWIKAIGYFPDDCCKETGYISDNSNSVYNYFEDFCLNKEDFDFKSENYGSLIRWRPNTLQGIENNNGWIKIESEDDLPKTRGDNDVFIVDFNGDITVGCSKLLAIKEIRSYWRATITHYQPIQKPKPPVY